MDLNILFKPRIPGNLNHLSYSGHRNVQYDHNGRNHLYLDLFKKLKSSKKLLVALSAAAVVILILVIALIIMIIPPIIKGLDTIQTSWISGLEGLIKALRPLLELLWSVTGK